MSQLPSSPTKIFDHPIIGIDQQQQFKANFEEMIMDEGNEIPTIELEQPRRCPCAAAVVALRERVVLERVGTAGADEPRDGSAPGGSRV